MLTLNLSWCNINSMAYETAKSIKSKFSGRSTIRAYGIPNGGIYAALAVQASQSGGRPTIELTEGIGYADLFIDDLVDTGRTRSRYTQQRDIPFYCLADKQQYAPDDKPWISFPWERMNHTSGPEDAVLRILEYIGEDVDREGLRETPKRVVKSYADLFSGYDYRSDDDVAKILKVFEDGACDEMVILRGIDFVSFCEHHMLPFTGLAHVAYLPHNKVIGVSKLARIVDIYSRRLQIQERLTQQITGLLDKYVEPLGSACVIEAVHECMTCRGVRKHESVMVTSSLTGNFRQPEVRAEFLSMINR